MTSVPPRSPRRRRPVYRRLLRQLWLDVEMAAREVLYRVWALQSKRAQVLPARDMEPAAVVIIACFDARRVRNLWPVVRYILRSGNVRQVILTCNNPELRLTLARDLPPDRVTILRQPQRRGAGYRWQVAREIDNVEYILVLDDDLLVRPRQVTTLIRSLAADPAVPHSLAGKRDRDYVVSRDATVDSLYMAYAVTRAHVRRYWELVARLEAVAGIGAAEIERWADDLVISNAGSAPSRVHDVGFVQLCPTANSAGVAIHREQEFAEVRERMFEALAILHLPAVNTEEIA